LHTYSLHHTITPTQTIIGFGGAFTEAASINFFKLPAAVRTKIISLYFDKEGAGYTLGRVPINSCDFSPESYSFDDVPDDYDLLEFDEELTHDKQFMIPLVRRSGQNWCIFIGILL